MTVTPLFFIYYYQWQDWQRWLIPGALSLGVMVLSWKFSEWSPMFSIAPRSGIYYTMSHVINIVDGVAEIFPYQDINQCEVVDYTFKGGRFSHSSVKLNSGVKGIMNFASREEARIVASTINQIKLESAGDLDFIHINDAKYFIGNGSGNKYRAHLVRIGAILVIGLCFGGLSYVINFYSSDAYLWNLRKSEAKIESFVAYLKETKKGYHNFEADDSAWEKALHTEGFASLRTYASGNPVFRHADAFKKEKIRRYEILARHIDELYSSRSDHKFGDVIQSWLRHAVATDKFEIPITFNCTKGVDSDLSSILARQSGFKVLPIGNAFSPSANKSRENEVAIAFSKFFDRIIPEKALTITHEMKSTFGIQIAYEVTPSGALYYNTEQASIPDSEKDFYPGVEYTWIIKTKGDDSTIYSFVKQSQPAGNFKYSGSNPYEGMAESAFDDLKSTLRSLVRVE